MSPPWIATKIHATRDMLSGRVVALSGQTRVTLLNFCDPQVEIR